MVHRYGEMSEVDNLAEEASWDQANDSIELIDSFTSESEEYQLIITPKFLPDKSKQSLPASNHITKLSPDVSEIYSIKNIGEQKKISDIKIGKEIGEQKKISDIKIGKDTINTAGKASVIEPEVTESVDALLCESKSQVKKQSSKNSRKKIEVPKNPKIVDIAVSSNQIKKMPETELRTTSEAENLYKKMLENTRMESRSTYLRILKATNDDTVLKRFIEVGGWNLLNEWLNAAKSDNIPFLLDLLLVFQHMPVTVYLLKKNSCAKTIKGFTKSSEEDIKLLSSNIVDTWMKIIRGDNQTNGAASSSDKHKKKRHKDAKESSSPSSKSHSSKSKDSKSDTSSDTIKNRPKTVKTAPSKFRSTGLEEQAPIQPGKKKSSIDKPPIKRHSPQPKSNQAPPEKKSRPNLPAPLPTTGASSTTTSPSTSSNTSPTETHGRIKLIPAKRMNVFESSGFMDALTPTYTPAVNPGKRKRKTSKGATSPPTPTSPQGKDPPAKDGKVPAVPSFYKDTMDSEEVKEESTETETNGDEVSSSSNQDVEMIEEGKEDSIKDDKSSETGSVAGSVTGSVKSEENIVPVKKKKKKVSWLPDNRLCLIKYFELDETERVNVNKMKSFEDTKKAEMMNEREFMMASHREARGDRMSSQIEWRRPPRITHITTPLMDFGKDSKEKAVQKEREQHVLLALYFSKEMIPDTPGEPDPEKYEHEEPRIMPLDDESGAGEVYEQGEYPQSAGDQPDSHPPPPPQLSLPPAMADLLASMASQVKDHQQQEKQEKNQHKKFQLPNGAPSIPPDMEAVVQQVLQQQGTQGLSEEQIHQLEQMLEPFQKGGGGSTGSMPSLTDMSAWNWNQMNPNMVSNYGPPMNGPPMMGPPHNMRPPFRGPGGPMMGPGPYRPNGPPPNMYGPGGPMGGPPMRGPMRGRGRGRGNARTTVCKYFAQKGSCANGDDCRFLHPGINGPPL